MLVSGNPGSKFIKEIARLSYCVCVKSFHRYVSIWKFFDLSGSSSNGHHLDPLIWLSSPTSQTWTKHWYLCSNTKMLKFYTLNYFPYTPENSTDKTWHSIKYSDFMVVYIRNIACFIEVNAVKVVEPYDNLLTYSKVFQPSLLYCLHWVKNSPYFVYNTFTRSAYNWI